MPAPVLHVLPLDDSLSARAEGLAAALGGVVGERPPGGALVLEVGPQGLALRRGDGPTVTAAVEVLARAPRPGPDLLWRAVLAGQERVVDATAGLGADAFNLLARGATVTLVERSPLLGALLADALERARGGSLGPEAAAAAARGELVVGDAREVLPVLDGHGVVYLDPMFQGPGARSLPPKGMALLREVLGADEEGAEGLLTAARAAASRRVVVKRHLRAEALAGVRPSGALAGRTVRFDLYAPV